YFENQIRTRMGKAKIIPTNAIAAIFPPHGKKDATSRTAIPLAASIRLFALLNALVTVACAFAAHDAHCGSTGALQYAHWLMVVLIISPHLGQAKTCGSLWPRIELIVVSLLEHEVGTRVAPRTTGRHQELWLITTRTSANIPVSLLAIRIFRRSCLSTL